MIIFCERVQWHRLVTSSECLEAGVTSAAAGSPASVRPAVVGGGHASGHARQVAISPVSCSLYQLSLKKKPNSCNIKFC